MPLPWRIGSALALVALLAAAPAQAAPGGPVLEYLQETLQPLIEGLETAVDAVQSALADLQATGEDVQSTVDAQPTLRIVKEPFTTLPNATTVFNLDVHSVPVGQFLKVKKYSVSLLVRDSVAGGFPGESSIGVVTGVIDGTLSTAYPTTVAAFDPIASSSMVIPPYVGTNSFIRVTRGADGLGSLDVVVNAYIESEP
jgi:hypothetical protein